MIFRDQGSSDILNRFPPPVVGNRGDSDTKGANDGGDIDRRYF